MFYILAPLKAQFHFALGPINYLADPRRKLVALLLSRALSERNGIISSHCALGLLNLTSSYITSRIPLCTLHYIQKFLVSSPSSLNCVLNSRRLSD